MPKTAAKPEPEAATAGAVMKIVVAGHVDHGKSTLIGRLLSDTHSLPDGKVEEIKRAAAKRGMEFEWAFLMDALQAERDQNVTIDVSHIGFKTRKRDYVIIDAPGHREFLKNTISGAAAAEAALIVIDAKEGVQEQSRRHATLLHLLGVHQVAVIVGKMDAVGYREASFATIEKEYAAYLKNLGMVAACFIPVCAREGDNVASRSARMPWYKGVTVIAALDAFTEFPSFERLPLRLPVQGIYKRGDKRILAGRIESGRLKVGDELLFSPTNQRAKVASIEAFGAATSPASAGAGESVGITLSDQIFIERGHVASQIHDAPILTNSFRARLFWLGTRPLANDSRCKLRLGTAEFTVDVKEVEQVIDAATLAPGSGKVVECGQVAVAVLRIHGLAAVDAFSNNPYTGRFVLVQDYDICGGGIIDLAGFADHRLRVGEVKSQNITALDLRITPQQRALMNGHNGGILWLTGLSGSGKSTLALELQQRLFARGCQVTVLDGDNVRHGLNRDLGFSAADRSENIRRVGEVAALFAQTGLIVIVAFISPYREDRGRAQAVAPDFFNLVHIKADLATCEKRDPKGLYKKARKGEIKDFTGISAPYEVPTDPDLVIDTEKHGIKESVSLLMDYVIRQFVDPVKVAHES